MEEPDLMDADLAADTALDANLDPTIDDLFGETTDPLAADALGVALPSLPLPPELVRYVAEMQTRGCCTKLAYSNTGSIAQIVDHGAKITFRAILRNRKTGVWSLLNESQNPILPPDGSKWEHIKFNNIGIDLAATDNQGRVFVYTLQGALGRMPLAPENIDRTPHVRPDLEAVVGLYWIPMYPTELRFPNVSAANKNGERWSTGLQLRDLSEPNLHHPADGRQALLYVSRDAKLTLMYQVDAEGGKYVYHAIDTRLEEQNSSADLISHAALTEEGDHLLLVTYSLSRCLRLYRINIGWNVTQTPRPSGQGMTTVPNPSFGIGRVTLVDHATPQHATAAQLSHLRIVSAIPSNASLAGVTTVPTIFAIFTCATLPVDVIQQAPEAYSVISRWHVESAVVPGLHEAFLKLSKNGSINTPVTTATQLERHEDIFTNKIILSFEPQCFNTILAFAASDGTVEFRDRVTMASIEPYPDTTTVTSLPQSGFEHLIDKHFVRVAMDGDGSALAAVNADGEMVHKLMSLRYTWDPIMDDAGLLEAAVVCLARQYTILTCMNISNNETLAMIPSNLSQEMRSLFVKEVIKMLRRDLDISMQELQRQQVTATKEGLLPKAMSAQIILARKPGTVDPTPGSKYATAFLNARLAASALTVLFSHGLRPEFITSIRGLAKWASDLLVYLADALLTLRQRRELAPDRPISNICEEFIAELDSPAVNLLLCSYSRTYLRFLVAAIPRYLSAVQRIMGIVRSTGDRMELIETHDYALSLPFKFTDYDDFLKAVDAAIRNAYTQGTVTAGRRSEIELSTITCDSTLPPELYPALQELCDNAFPALMEKMDLSKLRFWDTTWLGIEPSLERQKYDVIRKLPLTRGMKLRICRRCGAMMEDLSFEKMRDWAPTVSHLGRHCICADYWMLE